MRIFLSLLFIGILAVIYFFAVDSKYRALSEATPEAPKTPPAEESSDDKDLLLGDHMLADHGLAQTPAAYDVRLLHEFIETANIENRHIDTYFFSTNPDLTEILLGKEGMSRPQLSSNHPILGKNQYGETVLIDRWKTPYRVHLVERNNIEIFSAGPDQKMGTPDDFRWPPAR